MIGVFEMKAIQGWPTRQLRELADIRISNIDKKFYASEKPVKLCNYMDVYANEYVTGNIQFMEASATPAEIERFSLNRGDVIITKDSETPDDIGIPTVITEEIKGLVCGYHLALIRPNQEYLDPVYLAKQLCTSDIVRYFAIKASGSTRFGLPIGAIETVEIPTPPKPEQAKIAEILSTVDRAIEQTEALIAKQQRIKTGLMQDLLTRGIDEHGNLRSEQTHEFKDSPLGRIPVEWEVKRLDEITTKIADRDHTTPIYVEEGVLIVSPMAFYNDEGIDFNRCPQITEKAHELNSKKTDCKLGDIILHRIGAGLGRVRVITEDHPKYSILHSLALIRPDKAHIVTSFLKWSFRCFELQKQMGLGTQSIGVPDLGLDKIASLVFKVPGSLDEQKRIGTLLEENQRNSDQLISNVKKIRFLKTALMQDLLTGKKRVTALLNEMEVVHG